MQQKWIEAPTSKYINNQNSSDQSLKIKDIFSPKCQKEKMTLRFYSFLDDRTIKRGPSLYLEHGLKWMHKQAYLNSMKTLKKIQSEYNEDLKQISQKHSHCMHRLNWRVQKKCIPIDRVWQDVFIV